MKKKKTVFKDFDAFFKEKEGNSNLELQVFGKTHVIKADLPASITVKVMRAAKDGDTVEDSEMMAIAHDIFGTELLDEWVAEEMTQDQLNDIIAWVFAEINGRNAQEPQTNDDNGEEKNA
jgi:hypothetical protein